VKQGLCSATQSCRALGLARSSFYLRHRPNRQRARLNKRIIELSERHPRYGYRRVSALLRREGKRVNPKRVQRIRRQEGLQVRKKQRATRRVGVSTARRQRAASPNQVWSWDLIHDQTQGGSSLRILTLLDEYTKQCLAIAVGRSIRALDAIEVLEQAIKQYGQPEHIRSDNGPEFIAGAIRNWMDQRQIRALYISPGSPWEQAYIESFHDKFRDECLNRELFASVAEARVIIESWRKEYNHSRPHSALGYLTPQEFAASQQIQTTNCEAENGQLKRQAVGFDYGRPQSTTYPQSPLSGPSRCCDVTDPSRAFSQHAGPGRLWISLDRDDQSPLNSNKTTHQDN